MRYNRIGMNLQNARIFIAGHRGMVGSALIRGLENRGAQNIITRSRQELDLTNQSAVEAFMHAERPDIVIIAAAKVGGILANSTYPWEFLYENLVMETNLIGAAHRADVPRLVFLGSS